MDDAEPGHGLIIFVVKLVALIKKEKPMYNRSFVRRVFDLS